MKIGGGIQKNKCVIFNVLSVAEKGLDFLAEPSDIALPVSVDISTCSADTCRSSKEPAVTSGLKSTRKTKGSQILPTIHSLMSPRSNWFEIKEVADYQYPGTFCELAPKRLRYCADITQMPMYHPSSEDFLFSDIQFGKGTARHTRKITLSIDGKEEEVYYRTVPCKGVKVCGQSNEGCSYVVSTRETRRCPQHQDTPLVLSCDCEVEFVYIWPANPNHHRRWQSGILRT